MPSKNGFILPSDLNWYYESHCLHIPQNVVIPRSVFQENGHGLFELLFCLQI